MSNSERITLPLRSGTYAMAERLRENLSAAEGRRYGMTDTIDRAVGCLDEALTSSAFLNPADGALQAEQHVAMLITSALSQFVSAYMPDETLQLISFNYQNHLINAYIYNGKRGGSRLRRIILSRASEGLEPTEPLPAISLQGRRATVSLRQATYATVKRLSEELRMPDGRRCHMTDIIDRAVDCLEKVLTRSTLLKPAGGALQAEQHLAALVISALSQFVRAHNTDTAHDTDTALGDVTFKYDEDKITVYIDGFSQPQRIILAPRPKYVDPTEPRPEWYPEGKRRYTSKRAH